MANTLPLTEIVSQYTISVLPAGHRDFRNWSVTLTRHAYNAWRVLHGGYAFDGVRWQPEHSGVPNFDLKTAYRYAQEQAPLIILNGLTAHDILARDAERARTTTAQEA